MRRGEYIEAEVWQGHFRVEVEADGPLPTSGVALRFKVSDGTVIADQDWLTLVQGVEAAMERQRRRAPVAGEETTREIPVEDTTTRIEQER